MSAAYLLGIEPITALPGEETHFRSLGLTKREWFAGMALANATYTNPKATAEAALACADALLEELCK